MGYWDEAPIPRDQMVLIATTLGDRIPDDHPVRLFYDILASLDWSAWENRYCRVAGQPPKNGKDRGGISARFMVAMA